MSELQDKLNSLLSDPAGMAQVVQLAQQLSSTMEPSATPTPQGGAPHPGHPLPRRVPIPRPPLRCRVASTWAPSLDFCLCSRPFPRIKVIPCSCSMPCALI